MHVLLLMSFARINCCSFTGIGEKHNFLERKKMLTMQVPVPSWKPLGFGRKKKKRKYQWFEVFLPVTVITCLGLGLPVNPSLATVTGPNIPKFLLQKKRRFFFQWGNCCSPKLSTCVMHFGGRLPDLWCNPGRKWRFMLRDPKNWKVLGGHSFLEQEIPNYT